MKKKRDYDPQVVEKLRGSRHYTNQCRKRVALGRQESEKQDTLYDYRKR